MSESSTKYRIISIDIVRGLAMVIMALDHVRDYVHVTAFTQDPLNLETTTPELFLTRWITHFCAPTFVFLSGTSIYLQSLRKNNLELSTFLIKRGLWLVLLEFTVIAFGWSFNPMMGFLVMQVIWVIGISMIIIGVLIRFNLSYKALLIIGSLIVLGHNAFDIIEQQAGFEFSFIGAVLHGGGIGSYVYPLGPNHIFMVAYSFPAWTGVMILGYCLGKIFTQEFDPVKRKSLLRKIGFAMIAFFVVLRLTNLYGNPTPWTSQDSLGYTLLSFINVAKYPPSLLFICMTIGPCLLLLSWTEQVRGFVSRALIIFGRTALFYYIVHLYLIHFIAVILFFWRGHDWSQINNMSDFIPFFFVVGAEGFQLPGVFATWAIVLVFFTLSVNGMIRINTQTEINGG